MGIRLCSQLRAASSNRGEASPSPSAALAVLTQPGIVENTAAASTAGLSDWNSVCEFFRCMPALSADLFALLPRRIRWPPLTGKRPFRIGTYAERGYFAILDAHEAIRLGNHALVVC